jgi:hypothetical protein
MPTFVYNKKTMMDLMSSLEEDDVILLTGELLEASYSKKMGVQKVTFAYSPDVFERKDTVGHFARLPTWSFIICKRENISDHGLKLYDTIGLEEIQAPEQH